MIRPDYTDLGIVNLMASLRAGLAAGRRSYGAGGYAYPVCSALPPERVRDHPKVFLVVIDGLGFDYLRRQTGAPWLNAHLAAALSSVYPPTTTSAITTFLTGEAPLQHGMLGWFQRFAEFSQVFAVLTGQARGGGAPLAERAGDLRRLLGHVAFGERIGVRSHVVAPAHIAGSPYNLAHLGPAELHPFEGLDAGVAACTRLARRPGRAYVYVYWHGLDALGHEAGMQSAAAVGHLAAIDAALARLADALRGSGSLLLVTADHGHVDTAPADRLTLNDYPELTECLDGPVSGEPRTVYCHLKSGRARRFEGLVEDVLGGVVELQRPEDLLAQGWYGRGAPHPRVRAALGDYVLVLRERHAIYQRLPGESWHVQVGVHGGLSRAELQVPLVIAET